MGELGRRDFWLAALERAIKTFCQSLLALLGTNVTSITDVDWGQALGIAGLAAIASILFSISSVSVGKSGPSLGPEQLKETV